MSRLRPFLLPVLVLLIGVSVLGAGVWKHRASALATAPKKADQGITEARAYWKSRVDAVGPQKAYEEFEQKYVDSPPVAHLYAHVLGDLMYAKVGAKAITVCDDKFGYGCFHQVVSDMLADTGTSAIGQLNALCGSESEKALENCYHGLGHGMLDFFTPAHIADALDGCATMNGPSGAAGCESGVYMEYNVPIPVDGSDPLVAVRPFDPRHPNSPCDTPEIKDAYKESCYVSLSHWWDQHGFSTQAVAQMCHGVPLSSQKSCVEGISVDMPGRLNFDQAAIIKECDTITDATDRGLCLTSSAHMLEDFKKDPCAIWKELGEKKAECT